MLRRLWFWIGKESIAKATLCLSTYYLQEGLLHVTESRVLDGKGNEAPHVTLSPILTRLKQKSAQNNTTSTKNGLALQKYVFEGRVLVSHQGGQAGQPGWLGD